MLSTTLQQQLGNLTSGLDVLSANLGLGGSVASPETILAQGLDPFQELFNSLGGVQGGGGQVTQQQIDLFRSQLVTR